MEEKELTREQRIEELDGKIEKCKRDIAVFQQHLEARRAGLRQADLIQEKQVGEFLKNFADMPSTQIMEKIYKELPNENRSQLVGNISKIETAIKAETFTMKQYIAERDKIQKQIVDERLDGKCQQVCQRLQADIIDGYLKLEAAFQDVWALHDDALSDDPKYYLRAEKLGLHHAYMVILGSYLKPEYRSNLSLTELMDRISALHGYGPRLLEKRLNWQGDISVTKKTYF